MSSELPNLKDNSDDVDDWCPSSGDEDDETTLEEEEAINDEDIDEINALQEEQDLPVEELLRRYGYNNSSTSYEGSASPPLPSGEDGPSTCHSSTIAFDKTDIPTDLLGHDAPSGDLDELFGLQTSHEGTADTSQSLHAPSDNANNSDISYGYFSNFVDGEDDDETDDEYVPEEKWKKEIRVGVEYQANVPALTPSPNPADVDSHEAELLWTPNVLDKHCVEDFLVKVHDAVDSSPLAHEGGDASSFLSDDEQALKLLLKYRDAEQALTERKELQAIASASNEEWSEDECQIFETGLAALGKNFTAIQLYYLPHRTVAELVKFYYRWKKTERHNIFKQRVHLENKQYAFHPSNADHMVQTRHEFCNGEAAAHENTLADVLLAAPNVAPNHLQPLTEPTALGDLDYLVPEDRLEAVVHVEKFDLANNTHDNNSPAINQSLY